MKVISIKKDNEGDFWVVFSHERKRYVQVYRNEEHQRHLHLDIATDELHALSKVLEEALTRLGTDAGPRKLNNTMRESAEDFGISLD